MTPIRRSLCLGLSLLTAFLLPSQGWAQAAAAANAAVGTPLLATGLVLQSPSAGMMSLPFSNNALLAPNLSLPSALPSGASALRPEVKAQVSQPLAASRTHPVQASPVRVVETDAVGRIAPAASKKKDVQTLQRQAAVLTETAAPILQGISQAKASDTDLHSGGAALQSVLEGRAPSASEPIIAQSKGSRLSGLKPSVIAGSEQTPDPVKPPEAGVKTDFRLYGFGVSAVKTGLDALNLAVPLLLLDAFHAAMAVSALYLTAELARLVSGMLFGTAIDRLGPGKSMALFVGLQIAATTSLPFILAASGAWVMPAVYAVFILNGIGYELFDVARRAALPQIVGKDEGTLRQYNGKLYVWRELAATAGVFGAGYVVQTLGAMRTLWIHPVFCFAAVLGLMKLWGLRAKDDGQPAPPRESWRKSLREWWQDTLGGMKTTFANPQLRALVLINIPLTAVHKLFHTVVAVVYATQVLGNPAYAAVLVGAWNVGELAGAYYLNKRGDNSRFSSWLKLAAAASLSMWAFWLTPSIWLAVPVSLLIAAAMIGNELGTVAYMQSAVPEKDLGSVTGFVYGFSRAISMLSLLGVGWAFDALTASGGFLVLAVLFTLLAPIYLLTARSFSKQYMPKGGDDVPGDD
ncbi:MAG: MFS transporter [Elusimicrobiota bacterium]